MHARHILIVALILFVVAIFAGCSQPAGTGNSTAPPPAVPNVSFPDLILAPADLPLNYTPAESHVKNAGDVGSLGKDLGWSGGYVAQFANTAAGDLNESVITQSIAIYPENNIGYLIGLVNKQDRSDDTLSYINVTGVGDGGKGFYGRAATRIVVRPTNQNPLTTGAGSHDVQVIYTHDVAEEIFTKGTVFEVIRITGPDATPAFVEELAMTAYMKLP